MITQLVQFASVLVLILFVRYSGCEKETRPPCDSEIYCHGRLLHVIQMAKLFEDSKTFVDMKLMRSPNETLHRFDIFMKNNDNTPTKKQIRKFLSENFEQEGQEFEKWTPSDWKENPKFLKNILDPTLRQWGSNLNAIWKDLGRKLRHDIKDNQELYSIVWVPNPVIVPGGRFREFYYWDSYWIIKGLLLSEMYNTARGMLSNFLYIVDTYGLIPNGGRIYYLQRSQPPLLIPMIKLYVDAVKDKQFIRDHIETMEKEFTFWLTNHTRTVSYKGKDYTLAAYGERSQGPRPESYSEDVLSAEGFPEDQKEKYYSELKAAAESGWDFSSRWFISNGTNKGNLSSLNTRYIIPTDLNALVYWNAVILAEFHQQLNNFDKVRKYLDIAEQWMEAVTAVLWHEDIGAWLDYDVLNSVRRDYFYPTNLAPLWTNCFPKENKDRIVKLVLKYLQNVDVVRPGGIPSSLEATGEQWDYPNAWPPVQHMVVVGLQNIGLELSERLAQEISEIWVLSNFRAFNATQAMFEKYDATKSGGHGGGGEYEIQKGFGWTNGVIMDFLNIYGDVLRIDDSIPMESEIVVEPSVLASSTSVYGVLATGLLVLLLSFTAGFIGFILYKKQATSRILNKNFIKTGISPGTQYTELRNISKRSLR